MAGGQDGGSEAEGPRDSKWPTAVVQELLEAAAEVTKP
jgi:hypothetical protein